MLQLRRTHYSTYLMHRILNIEYNYTSITIIYVTGFDKTRLPHTSDSLTSNSCNSTIHNAIALEI